MIPSWKQLAKTLYETSRLYPKFLSTESSKKVGALLVLKDMGLVIDSNGKWRASSPGIILLRTIDSCGGDMDETMKFGVAKLVPFHMLSAMCEYRKKAEQGKNDGKIVAISGGRDGGGTSSGSGESEVH